MSPKDDFSRLERKAYLSYHQDGLVDIIIGLCIIGFSLNMLVDNAAFSALGWLPILLLPALKRWITVPRFGYVKFESTRSAAARKAGIVTIFSLLVLLGLVFFVLFIPGLIPLEVRAWLGENFMLTFGLIGAAAFAGAGLVTKIQRLYGYAGLTLLLLGGSNFINIRDAYSLLVLGGLIIVVGLVMVTHFVRKYPIIDEEQLDEIK